MNGGDKKLKDKNIKKENWSKWDVESLATKDGWVGDGFLSERVTWLPSARPDRPPETRCGIHGTRVVPRSLQPLICPPINCSFYSEGWKIFGVKWELGKGCAGPSLAARSRQAQRDWILQGGAHVPSTDEAPGNWRWVWILFLYFWPWLTT